MSQALTKTIWMCFPPTRANNDCQMAPSENFWPLTSCLRHHLSSRILPVLLPSTRWCLTDLESTAAPDTSFDISLVGVVAPRFAAFPSVCTCLFGGPSLILQAKTPDEP
jgi:hypothetical protein